ncbi:MAG: aminoglycoside 6-adenylyltransferase [Candidatus Poribacteria bacterium]|nr:aminoglycoside 6-adenylyltransferase [Candidatus Poribacteria bacterium]
MSITPIQQTYIDGLVRFAETDPRVRALWLEGSIATGRADRYSDVDAHLLVEPAALEAFRHEGAPPFESIRPTVLGDFLFGSMWNLLTVDGLRVDIWVHGSETHDLTGKAADVRYDDVGALIGVGAPGNPSTPDFVAMLQRTIPEFWRMISMTPAVIGRREFVVSNIGLALEANLLGEVLIVGEGIVRDRGVKNLNAYLPDNVRVELERALEAGALSQESLATAHLRLATIMMRRGREIAARHGYDYPQALEETVIRYVSAELEQLGLASTLSDVDQPGM